MGLFGRKKEDDLEDEVTPDIQSLLVLEISRKDLLPAIERALPPADEVMRIRMEQFADGTYPYLFNHELELTDATMLRLHIQNLLEWTWGTTKPVMFMRDSDGQPIVGQSAVDLAEANPGYYVALTKREFVERALGPSARRRLERDLDHLPDAGDTFLFAKAGIDEYFKITSKDAEKRSKKLTRR